jgi:AbiV family abortive infection protein
LTKEALARKGFASVRSDGLTELSVAALRNAERLLKDSETLLRAGSYPTAHAIAVLALEELGKHAMVIGESGRRALGRLEPTTLRSRMQNHRAKLTNALAIARALATTPEQSGKVLADLAAVVGSETALKLSGLYVDFKKGRVRAPSDCVTEKDARRVYATASRTIAMAKKARTATIDLDNMPEDRASDVRTQVVYVESLSPDKAAELIARTLQSIEKQ